MKPITTIHYDDWGSFIQMDKREWNKIVRVLKSYDITWDVMKNPKRQKAEKK